MQTLLLTLRNLLLVMLLTLQSKQTLTLTKLPATLLTLRCKATLMRFLLQWSLPMESFKQTLKLKLSLVTWLTLLFKLRSHQTMVIS